MLNNDISLLGGYPPGGGLRDPASNETIIDIGSVAASCITGADGALVDGFSIMHGSGTYVGSDGERHRPVMLHRVILGAMERFIGV
jgi:hypothetical protein